MSADVGSVALSAASFAGIAAALAVPSPIRQLRAARSTEDGVRTSGVPNRVGRVILGRPDAPALSRRVLVAAMAGAAVGFAFARAAPHLTWIGIACVPVIAVAVIIALGRIEPAASRRRRCQLIIEAPQAWELLASCLTAGLPLRGAVAAVVGVYSGPIAEDLGTVLRLIDLGVSEPEAWRTLRRHPQLGSAAIDLARSAEWGTMLVDTLNHHARVGRDRRQAALQVSARAVGVRCVLPLMTCFLPAFLLIGIVPAVVSAISHALS